MATTYNLFLSDGTLDLQIAEGTVVNRHGLSFTGFLKPGYGDDRDNNLLHFLENFASEEDPGNPGNPLSSVIDVPLVGQFWVNKTTFDVLVYNGTSWSVINNDISENPLTFPVSDITSSVTITKNQGLPIAVDNFESKNNLDAHINDTVDAHDASAISFTPYLALVSTETQSAINEVQTDLNTHILLGSGAHVATAISFTPFGSISSTTTQGAIGQLEGELNTAQTDIATVQTNLNTHIADPTAAHAASAISYDSTISGLGAFEVQTALDNLNTLVGTSGSQSVIDSLRVYRSGAQGIPVTTTTKLGFNTLQFGDDYGQFNTVTSRYTAAFDQDIRVRFYAGLTSIAAGSIMNLYIYKNGSPERLHTEDNYADSSAVPVDAEITCILNLTAGDYVEAYIQQFSGTRQVDTSSARTAMEIDIIKIFGTPPPVPVVFLSDQSISAAAVSPSVATASFTVQSDGDMSSSSGTVSPGFASNEWYTSNPLGGIGASYQVRLVTLSGTLSSGTADTWLSLSSNRTFTVTQSVIGSNTFSGVLQIRDTATLTIQDQANFSLSAVVTVK